MADKIIEVEDRVGTQHDEAYDDENESYTTSLSSSILKFQYENGRRYHAERDSPYVLPNDETEQERLDLVHALYRLLLDGALISAPVNKPKKVLDIGTGTGIWAIEFADENPDSEVIGTDITPIQPLWVPQNCTFEIDDAEAEWTFDSKFDFIHLRSLGGSISDMSKLIKQTYDHLEPGAWIEWQEFETTIYTDDDSIPKDSPFIEWIAKLNESSAKLGKDIDIAAKLKGEAEKAGFINVTEKTFKVPLGPWAKDEKLKTMGRWNQMLMLESLEPYSLFLFTKVLGWTAEDVKKFLGPVRKDLKNPNIHQYAIYHYVIGQRPE